MTVAELITKLQACDPRSVVAASIDGEAGLLEDADVQSGWFCPGLLDDGNDDFWGDGERCSSFPEGVYQPRSEDVRAIYLRIEG